MDYDKYYRLLPNGTYSIHFSNRRGHSEDIIKEIFSFYGKVLDVSWKGTSIIDSLVFVKYGTKHEMLYCLENIQKNNGIRILPQKDKISKPNVQQNSNGWQPRQAGNSSEATSITGKQHYSNTTSSSKTLTLHEDKPTCRNSDYPEMKCDYKSYVNASKPNKLDLLVVDDEDSQSLKQQDCNKISCNQVTKQPEINLNWPSKTEVKPSMWDEDTCNGNKIPSLIPNSEVKPEEPEKEKNHSIPRTEYIFSEPVVTMQEVIVANIHAKYGVHYILHLFEKHNPISATLVKTIFKTDIRYCIVYFMNKNDALAIEKEFDNFALLGRNLIVLQKSQLENVICKQLT